MIFIFGYSIYLSHPLEDTVKTIKKMSHLHPSHVFTSLHIPEHTITSDALNEFFEAVRTYKVPLIVDVSPKTLSLLSLSSIYELSRYPIKALRLDYGFDLFQMIELSHTFELVLNASTLTEQDLITLKNNGMNFDKLYVLHNFYPRPETGLGIKQIKSLNKMFHNYHIKTMAFIPGDDHLRLPLFQGLPTIETHRYQNPFLSYLELKTYGEVDVVLVGDPSLKSETHHKFKSYFNKQTIELGYQRIGPASDKPRFESTYTNRRDAAQQVIRATESRLYASNTGSIQPLNNELRPKGSITIDNERYGRYAGEIQLTLIDLPASQKVNVFGKIADDDLGLLYYIEAGSKFKLYEVKK
ncbi:MAG: MupG family TIM beta-alpha barrel fold protein [Turicibacter sp.]